MFSSPTGAVVGATNVAAMVRFFEVFGFTPSAESDLPARAARALYGVERTLEDILLTMAGSDRGTVRVVGPVKGALPADEYDTGAYAIDLYTRDLDASLDVVHAAGYDHGPVGHVELGPIVMDEAHVHGPDGLRLVLTESERPWTSRLDSDPSALHSEGNSLIWAVDSIAAALEFWRGLLGVTVPFDIPVAHPELTRCMGLSESEVPLRIAMVCDEALAPMRMELLEFVGKRGRPRPAWPLYAGLHGPAFEVDDLTSARTVLSSAGADVGDVVEVGARRGCSAMAPGGVRFEVWA